ncbi:MAG: hypothetical protein ABFS86_00620 [Planctomycetota bacterium]
MKIANCPGCGADLELPPGGGRVVCPYCETEFAPSGVRAPTPGGGAPRRGGGRPRGRRDDGYDEVEDDRRGYRRKKVDPTPIIVALIAVVVLGGGLAFFLMKSKQRETRQEEARIAKLQRKANVFFPPPNQLTPTGNAYEFFCDYQQDEKVTFQRMDYNAQVSYSDSHGAEDKPIYSETYSISNNKEITNERIVSREGDIVTHRGRYQIRGFRIQDRNLVPDPVWIEARFKTNRLGNFVPGSLEQVEGTTLPMLPPYLPERGFGIIDGAAHRQGERWGRDRLPDKVFDMLDIGFDPRGVPAKAGGRHGGWYISSGNPIKTSRGNWEKRQAHLKLSLNAVENRYQQNGRYRGRPAEISVAVRWTGGAMYELGKRMISHVQALSVGCEVVVKTSEGWYHWHSSEHIDAVILKDS